MTKRYPFYFKATVVLFGLTLLVYVLINLKEILVPICFAMMLALLLNRLVLLLQRLNVPRTWSIFISILIAFTALFGVGYFLSTQILSFGDDLPVLKQKFGTLSTEFQVWVDTKLGIDIKKQDQWISDAENSMKPLLGETLGTMAGTLGILFLLPVYTFLILYYKHLITNFVYEVFEEADSKKVADVILETKTAIQRYMVGLLLEGLVVAALNIVVLLALDVKYAVLLGVIGAILNVLPYIGGAIAIILPVIMATITKDGIHTQLLVTGFYLVIQFIDNHVLIPFIVSSRVKINALISIIVVLLGGALWGIAGMFLSIPFTGVLKILFDRIEEMKPWGKLLGTEEATISRIRLRKKKKPVTTAE